MPRQAELSGVVKPAVDDQALDREASKMEKVFGESANITASVDTSALRRKLERAIPAGGLLGGAFDKLSGGGGGGDSGGGDAISGTTGTGIQAAQLETLQDIHEEIEKMAASGGGGGGGSMLSGIGLSALLGGSGAAAGGTALAAGGIMGLGAGIGKGARNFMQGQLGEEHWASQGEGISGTSYAYNEEDGLGGSAEPLITAEDVTSAFSGFEWPEIPNVSVPDWLQNLELDTPDWMSGDLNLDTPDWMTGDLDLETPDWMSGDLNLNTPDWMTGDLNLQVPDWLQNLTPGSGSNDGSDGSNGGGNGNWIGDPTKNGPWYQGPDPFNLGPNNDNSNGNNSTNRAANNGSSNRSGDLNTNVDVTVEQQQLDRQAKQDIIQDVMNQLERNLPSDLFG